MKKKSQIKMSKMLMDQNVNIMEDIVMEDVDADNVIINHQDAGNNLRAAANNKQLVIK